MPDVDDPSAVELGVKFRSDVDGFVTGVRFYKGADNTGTHVGNLWTTTGTLLATATFASETPSGWQQVLFDAPVPITANTTYVVSYHTNVGALRGDRAATSQRGVDAPPLHAPTSARRRRQRRLPVRRRRRSRRRLQRDQLLGRRGVRQHAGHDRAVHCRRGCDRLDGATAIVTWTTDEQSTSSVDYSTEATFLPATTQTFRMWRT